MANDKSVPAALSSSTPPSTPDFAEEMRAKSWKHWTDAHPPASPETPAELTEALDAVVAKAIEARDSLAWPDPASLYEYNAARSALLALYDRQREESIRRTTEVPDPEWWAPQSLVTKLEAEVASLSSQLERMKADVLTPEEAQFICDDWGMKYTGDREVLYQSLRVKLKQIAGRRLSSGDSENGDTANE